MTVTRVAQDQSGAKEEEEVRGSVGEGGKQVTWEPGFEDR